MQGSPGGWFPYPFKVLGITLLNHPDEFLGVEDSTGNSIFPKRLPPDTEQALVPRHWKIRLHFSAKGKITVVLGIASLSPSSNFLNKGKKVSGGGDDHSGGDANALESFRVPHDLHRILGFKPIGKILHVWVGITRRQLGLHQSIGFISLRNQEINLSSFSVSHIGKIKIAEAKICPDIAKFKQMEGDQVLESRFRGLNG